MQGGCMKPAMFPACLFAQLSNNKSVLYNHPFYGKLYHTHIAVVERIPSGILHMGDSAEWCGRIPLGYVVLLDSFAPAAVHSAHLD